MKFKNIMLIILILSAIGSMLYINVVGRGTAVEALGGVIACGFVLFCMLPFTIFLFVRQGRKRVIIYE